MIDPQVRVLVLAYLHAGLTCVEGRRPPRRTVPHGRTRAILRRETRIQDAAARRKLRRPSLV